MAAASSSRTRHSLVQRLNARDRGDGVPAEATPSEARAVDATFSTHRFAETVCPQAFRHSKWTSFSRMLSMYDFRKVSSTPRSGAAPARAGLAPMVFEHDSFRSGRRGNQISGAP